MSRKKKQPETLAPEQQAPQEIQREMWNNQFKGAAPYFDPATGEVKNAAPVFYDLNTREPVNPPEPPGGSCFTVVTNDRPVVPVEINAETLYGIKPDCCDLPRLLKAILDELITQRGPIC